MRISLEMFCGICGNIMMILIKLWKFSISIDIYLFSVIGSVCLNFIIFMTSREGLFKFRVSSRKKNLIRCLENLKISMEGSCRYSRESLWKSSSCRKCLLGLNCLLNKCTSNKMNNSHNNSKNNCNNRHKCFKLLFLIIRTTNDGIKII